ncbi:PREDICTED: probable protein S-acyltransferase 5 [Tarenaya hassleriana]|uniref:probable protein S-acyltransferase 5 n=1 Tax=Tarenaya hassleriana TaxID=28532 RepID=UPI00053C8B14|nr:PREDICTED: probable protein S-acyltransferase 5 [Tarenaya hassleriana]
MLGLQPPAHHPGAQANATAAGVGDGGGAELIRTYKAWKGNNVFFLGGRLVFGPDAQSILLSIFLITAPTTIFCVFVARKFMDDFPHDRGASILAIAIGLNLLDLIFLLLTSGRDPGIIPRNLYPPEGEEGEPRMSRTPPFRLPRTKDMVVNGVTVKIKYCDTCMLYRPPRASHCSICNNCVQKFDHHCPWLGQCVGLRNYRFYFMFVLCSTLLCIYVHVFCWIYVKRIMDGERTTIWKALIKTPASIALILYTFVSVWFVGGLTGFHLYLISTNQSTYENFRYRYDRQENPFNKGILRNFLEVFCSSVPPRKNNFRAKITNEPRTMNGALSSPSFEKAVHDIEMGRKPVWHETVEEELDIPNKDGETAVVSQGFSRIIPPEGRGIMHSRESSSGSWVREDSRGNREPESKRLDDCSDEDQQEMDDISRELDIEVSSEESEMQRR